MKSRSESCARGPKGLIKQTLGAPLMCKWEMGRPPEAKSSKSGGRALCRWGMGRPPEATSTSSTLMCSRPFGAGGCPPLGMMSKDMRLGYTSMLPSTCAPACPPIRRPVMMLTEEVSTFP